MQRIFIAQECLRDFLRVPLTERKDLSLPLKQFLQASNEGEISIKPVQAGDKNTFALELGKKQTLLIRQFPESENSDTTWVWLALVANSDLQDLAKTIRISWDGETAGLIRVDPKTGTLGKKPFSRYHGRDLAAWGVPANLTEKVFLVSNEEELQNLEGDLTPRTYALLAGKLEAMGDWEEDLQILNEKTPAKELKTIENEIAENMDDLFHSDRFCLLESPEEIQKITDQDSPSWMFFPTPDQKKWLTRNVKGPVLIRGVAGSGKTSLGLLRAKYLAQEILEDNNDWILVITPHRHMAKFLKEDFQILGGTNANRVEINHLYGWASSYLQEIGVKAETNQTQALELLKEAIDSCRPGMPNITPSHLDFNFVRDELAFSIKGRALHSQPDYLTLPRRGFGTPLSGEERRHLWRIYLKYQDLLATHDIMDSFDLLVETHKNIQKKMPQKNYACIIVDDVQDLPPLALKIFNQISNNRPNGFFMLSDVTQKHLRTGDLLSHLEIEIAVRPPLLRDNLRNTREICQMGQNLLDGSRFEEIDGSGPSQAVQPEVSKKGFEPTLIFHETEEQEILWLVELITELTSESHGYQHGDIALIARTNRTLTFLELNLEQAQIPAQYFKKSGHDRTSNKVKICSYLDCKGMDFPVVILLEGVDQILPTVPTGIDSDEMSAHLTREKALLYCGMCRAKEMLYISGAEGEPSRFLAPLMEALEAKPEASTEDEPAEESALAEENA